MSEAVGAQRSSRDERFISALEHLVTNDDRAALAALRRGLGQQPGETMELYPYVVPYTQGLQYTSDENAYYSELTSCSRNTHHHAALQAFAIFTFTLCST